MGELPSDGALGLWVLAGGLNVLGGLWVLIGEDRALGLILGPGEGFHALEVALVGNGVSVADEAEDDRVLELVWEVNDFGKLI